MRYAALLALALAACADSPPGPRFGDPPPPNVDPPPGDWKYLGTLKEVLNGKHSDAVHDYDDRFTTAWVHAGGVYITEWDLDELHSQAEGVSLPEPFIPEGLEVLGAGPVRKGIAGGTDERIRVWNTLVYPMTAIGWLDSGCTASTVDNAFLMTAAHCMLKRAQSTGELTAKEYYPALNTVNFAPYGGWTVNDALFDANYLTQCNPDTDEVLISDPCSGRDWAIVWVNSDPDAFQKTSFLLPEVADISTQFSAYRPMRHHIPEYTIEGEQYYNVGYPGCTQPEAPAGCVPLTPWMSFNGHAFDIRHKINGQQSVMSTELDMGRGHSGSPMFTEVGFRLHGIASAAACRVCPNRTITTCSGAPNSVCISNPDPYNAHPNHFARITQTIHDYYRVLANWR